MRFAAGRAAANRSKRPSVLDLAANAEDPTDESIVLDEIDHLGSLDSRKEVRQFSAPPTFSPLTSRLVAFAGVPLVPRCVD